MASMFGYDITNYGIKLIEWLLNYREVQPHHLASLQYGVNFSQAQEKTIYKYLRKLKKQKLIKKNKLQGDSRGSGYCHTPKGLELAKELLDIEEGKIGEGWINENGCTSYGDFPYNIYSPPKEQQPHHLLLVDLFNKLHSIKTAYIEHRINHYCAVTFETEVGKFRFRPDGEVRFKDGRNFAIEIDRGSENHEQLCKKFRTYRQYYDYCEKNGLDKKHAGIIFVVEDKRKKHGMKRRWKNISAAFFQELGDYYRDVNLILTTISDANETLLLELNRKEHELESVNKLKSLQEQNGNMTDNFLRIKDQKGSSHKVFLSTSPTKENGFYITVFSFSHPYETFIYRNYMEVYRVLNEIKGQESVKDLEFIGFKMVILYGTDEEPYLINDYFPYTLSEELKTAFLDFGKDVEYIKVE